MTADQFGAAPVVVAAAHDPRYGPGDDTAPPQARAARRQAVDRLWPDWAASGLRRDLPAQWAELGRTAA